MLGSIIPGLNRLAQLMTERNGKLPWIRRDLCAWQYRGRDKNLKALLWPHQKLVSQRMAEAWAIGCPVNKLPYLPQETFLLLDTIILYPTCMFAACCCWSGPPWSCQDPFPHVIHAFEWPTQIRGLHGLCFTPLISSVPEKFKEVVLTTKPLILSAGGPIYLLLKEGFVESLTWIIVVHK